MDCRVLSQRMPIRIFAASILITTLLSWLQYPPGVGATSDCNAALCVEKANWTGARGTFSGGSTTIRAPVNIYADFFSTIYMAQWVWDDDLGALVVVGMKYTGSRLHYFWGDQRPGEGYYEDLRQDVPQARRGTNINFQIHRTNPNEPGVFQVVWYSDDFGEYGNLASYPNYMQPTRKNIGFDVRGPGLYVENTPFTRNQYILNAPGQAYYHTGYPNYYSADPPGSMPFSYWFIGPPDSGTGGDWRVYVP